MRHAWRTQKNAVEDELNGVFYFTLSVGANLLAREPDRPYQALANKLVPAGPRRKHWVSRVIS